MENGIVNLSNFFDRSIFTPSVVCLHSSGVMEQRLKPDVKVHCMNFREVKRLLRPFSFAKYLQKEKIDIIHTHAWGGGSFTGIMAAKIAKVPVVINGEHGSFFTKRRQIIAQKILFNLCDANLAVSESLKIKISKKLGVSSDRITVIRNGVDSNIFSGQYSKNKILNTLKSNGYDLKDKFIIISVGSLKPEKGQIFLLEAVRKLVVEDGITQLTVIFAGDGPDMKKLSTYRKHNKLCNNVFFLGNRSDIPELLTIADLLVSTSVGSHEGLSNVMLEAMSSSVPVIATKSVGTEEVVQDGYNGFLIPQGDHVFLATIIRSLIDNPKLLLKISNNSKTTAENNFSIAAMVQAYQDLYLKLFQKR
jgi:glycosyltransferase involved in cell wall biosynthesis